MPLPRTPAHHQAEAAFKKPKTENDGEGAGEYQARQAAQLANMERLRTQRLAREVDKSTGGMRKARSGAAKKRKQD